MILKRLQIHTELKDPTNCYIVFDEETKETMVIDPGAEVEKIIDMIDILKREFKIYLCNTLSWGSYWSSKRIANT